MRIQAGMTLGCTALLLSACGGSGETQGGGDKAAKVASDSWDATNACALLDKAVLGAALKDNVTETSLAFVNAAGAATAATSECTYMLASGSRASLTARWSPIADNTDEVIAAAKKTSEATVAAFGKTIEDVPNLGKGAFFVPGINQMNVFLDDRKFVILTISSAPNDTAKTIAIELVKILSTNETS